MLLGQYRNLLPAEGNEGDSGLLQCSCSRPQRNGLKCWHEHFASYIAAIFPTVKGQKSGKASVIITTPKCSVAVQFPWGDGSYKIQ
jgi:hypothetical protein